MSWKTNGNSSVNLHYTDRNCSCCVLSWCLCLGICCRHTKILLLFFFCSTALCDRIRLKIFGCKNEIHVPTVMGMIWFAVRNNEWSAILQTYSLQCFSWSWFQMAHVHWEYWIPDLLMNQEVLRCTKCANEPVGCGYLVTAHVQTLQGPSVELSLVSL